VPDGIRALGVPNHGDTFEHYRRPSHRQLCHRYRWTKIGVTVQALDAFETPFTKQNGVGTTRFDSPTLVASISTCDTVCDVMIATDVLVDENGPLTSVRKSPFIVISVPGETLMPELG